MDTKEHKYLKHMLGNTIEEAEEVFNKYKNFLNGVSYTYSVSTGIEKADLFGEAVFGLAKALVGFDPSRNFTLLTYATRVVRTVLNDYVRRNTYSVFVPPYIKRANRLINLLKTLMYNHGVDDNEIATVMLTRDISLVPKSIVGKCTELINLIDRAAKRAYINYESLVSRSEFIPTDVDITDKTVENMQILTSEDTNLNSELLVSYLKDHMNDVELSIANGIMSGKTYEDIGKEHGKTRAWVKQKLDIFRDRVKKRLEDKTYL